MEKSVIENGWFLGDVELQFLATFFVGNLDLKYISHGEIQSGRATNHKKWNGDIINIITTELSDASLIPISKKDGTYIALSRLNGKLVAMAILRVFTTNLKSYIQLEDIVVSEEKRGTGVGFDLLKWVEMEVSAIGINEIFLESGKDNADAHNFFIKNGFQEISKTFYKTLQ
jgi:GNAT superfamily N-acetyltransferase